MTKVRSFLTFLIGWPLSLVALIFITHYIITQFSTLQLQSLSITWPLLLFGFGLLTSYYLLRSYIWHVLLRKKGQTQLRFQDSALLWGISELRRYIPGNIWSFISRGVLFKKKGVPVLITTECLLIEVQLIVLGSLLASLFSFQYLAHLFLPFPLTIILTATLFLLTGACCLFFLFSRRFTYLVNKKPFSYVVPNLAWQDAMHLLLFYVTAFVLFGLGNYFVTVSIIYLDPKHLLTYIGLFSFSLLLGYLSFIMPMGLGVREGAVIFFLSKFMAVPLAGITALYTRIALVFSELVFLAIAWLLSRTKQSLYDRWASSLRKYMYEVFLAVSIGIYICYFITTSFLRHMHFFSGRFDLGNMDQTVWNTANGRFFQLTNPDGTDVVSRLAFHADFILVLLAPFYWIWSDPRMLLLIQTVVLALGAVFVYLLAKNMLQKKSLAFTFAVVYLINPAVHYTNLYDFHAVTFATTFLLGAWYFLQKRNYVFFSLFAILAALTKEQIWLIVALLGLFLVISGVREWKKSTRIPWRKLLLGTMLCVGSIVFFEYLITIAIPQALGNQHFALSYYSDFGDSPTAILKTLVFSPDKIVATVFQPERIEYLKQLFMPLGYLSFLAPLVLLFTAPDLGISLLSSNANLYQIYYQYTAAITPFLFIAALYGVRLVRRVLPFLSPKVLIVYLLYTSIMAAYSYGPLPIAQNPSLAMFTRQLPYRQEIQETLNSIPQEYTVAASNNLGAHLSHREYIYTLPIGIYQADVVTILLGDVFAQPSPETQRALAEQLKQDPDYRLVKEKDQFFVFIKKDLPL